MRPPPKWGSDLQFSVWGFLPGSTGANESKAHRGLPALRPGSWKRPWEEDGGLLPAALASTRSRQG